MRVQRIDNQTTNFKATIKQNPEWNSYISYIEKNSNAPKGWFDTLPHKNLIQKIVSAFEKHPSDAELNFSVYYRQGELFNARGTVLSQYAHFYDTEPARSDSIAPIENIIRRMLDPENQGMLDKLLGKQYSSDTPNWWNENIKPIWKDINEQFYEETIYKKRQDKYFNENFRNKNFYAEI